jgi:uncharacterized delta-60 repeat protein
MRTIKLILLGCLVFNCILSYSQETFLDPTFSGGRVTSKFTADSDSATSVAIQSDGKIVVAGVIDGSFKNKLGMVRYHSNGIVDSTFGVNGLVVDSFIAPFLYTQTNFKMLMQANGKFVVSAFRRISANDCELFVVRYTTDGSRDNSFGQSGIAIIDTMSFQFPTIGSYILPDIGFQSGDKIIYTVDGSIYRILPSGVRDLSFGVNGKVVTGFALFTPNYYQKQIMPVLIQADDKIIVSAYQADTLSIIRFDANGSFDATFLSKGFVTAKHTSGWQENHPLLQSDGKIVVCGIEGVRTGSPIVKLARLLSSGIIDSTYGVYGVSHIPMRVGTDLYFKAIMNADDKVVFKLEVADYDTTVFFRTTTAGSIDATFGINGKIGIPFNLTNGIRFQTDGKIVCCGAVFQSSTINYGFNYPFSVYRISLTQDTTTVWPGDANHNRLVDNVDLLPLGLSYGLTGVARIDQGIDWESKVSANWGVSSPMVYDVKHTDCNGDGIINANDILAISQNFGLNYSKTGEQPAPWRAGTPGLSIVLSKDTVRAGDTLIASIQLGDVSLPVSSIYGLAFTYNYDALVVDTTQTEVLYPSSWLATTSERITIVKDFKTTGQIKTAVTRINHVNRSGNGEIAQIKFKITTDNISGKNLMYYNNVNFISAVTAIDSAGNPIDLNAGVDSALVEFTPTGIRTIEQFQAAIYPNPASGKLFIKSDEALLEHVTLCNLLGETIVSEVATGSNKTIDVSGISNGVYILHLETNKGELFRRIVISK